MAITTLTTVKTVLGYADTTKDALISLYIPKVEADYLNIRGVEFATVNDVTAYPDGADITAALMIGYLLKAKHGLQSESIGSYSYSAEGTDKQIGGYPKSIVGTIKRYIGI